MPVRKGGAGKCAACADPRQAEINADLVGGALSLAKIAARYGISESSLGRHRLNHISRSLKAVGTTISAPGTSARDRLETIIKVCEDLLDTARSMSLVNMGQALAAVRELRATIELLARITGELDERPTTVINVLSTPEWMKARWVILDELTPYPDVRARISNRLQALEAHPLALPPGENLADSQPESGPGVGA